MGNLSSTFEIRDQIGSGGPGNLWKVSNASRKSNGQAVAVFVFERNFLESMRASVTTKKDQDRAHELLKKEAVTLSRLRHPCLLEVAEAVQDSPTALAFGSEPILCCLSNVFGNFSNFGSIDRSEFKKAYDLDELEIQKGILQLIKGLEFLHNNKWIHCALSPESIYINAKGDWKISGLNFSRQITASSESAAFYFSDYPPFCSPSLDYMAPEAILDEKCCTASDTWSLGCIIYAVFNSGIAPISANGNIHNYKSRATKVDQLQFDRSLIPPRLIDSLRRLLVRDPFQRITLEEFQHSDFFDNILISTISFLETLVEKTAVNKAQFFKGLVKVLPQFSVKILTRKVLPILVTQLKDAPLSPFVLPCIFWISDQVSDEDFNSTILPALKPIFKISDPPQAVMLLLSRMDIFAKKCPNPDIFKQDVIPLLYSALDMPVVQVQEQAVKVVPTIISRLDFTTIKTCLFPKLQAIYTSSSSLAVRIGALIAIHSTIKLLDKFALVEKIIPLLKENKVREASIIVALLAVHAEIANHIDKEVIATEILPELWKLAVDQILNVNQFKKFMRVIHELTTRVEEQHTKFLQEMKTIDAPIASTQATTGDVLSDFASLVKGTPSTPLSGGSGSVQSRSDDVKHSPNNVCFNIDVAYTDQPIQNAAIPGSFEAVLITQSLSQPTSTLYQKAPITPDALSSTFTNATPLPTTRVVIPALRPNNSVGAAFSEPASSTAIPVLKPPPTSVPQNQTATYSAAATKSTVNSPTYGVAMMPVSSIPPAQTAVQSAKITASPSFFGPTNPGMGKFATSPFHSIPVINSIPSSGGLHTTVLQPQRANNSSVPAKKAVGLEDFDPFS